MEDNTIEISIKIGKNITTTDEVVHRMITDYFTGDDLFKYHHYEESKYKVADRTMKIVKTNVGGIIISTQTNINNNIIIQNDDHADTKWSSVYSKLLKEFERIHSEEPKFKFKSGLYKYVNMINNISHHPIVTYITWKDRSMYDEAIEFIQGNNADNKTITDYHTEYLSYLSHKSHIKDNFLGIRKFNALVKLMEYKIIKIKGKRLWCGLQSDKVPTLVIVD